MFGPRSSASVWCPGAAPMPGVRGDRAFVFVEAFFHVLTQWYHSGRHYRENGLPTASSRQILQCIWRTQLTEDKSSTLLSVSPSLLPPGTGKSSPQALSGSKFSFHAPCCPPGGALISFHVNMSELAYSSTGAECLPRVLRLVRSVRSLHQLPL